MLKKLFLFRIKLFKTDGKADYASGITRFIAVLFDLIFLSLIFFVIGNITEFIVKLVLNISASEMLVNVQYYDHLPESTKNTVRIYIAYKALLNIFELALTYYLLTTSWVKYGATPGKYLLGLRVVDENSFKFPSRAQATRRFFGIFLSIAPLGLGIIWSFFSKKGQTWHDKIAHTLLVKRQNLEQNHLKQ